MASTEANQYTVTGGGIEGVVNTSSITGQPQASLEVDGTPVADLALAQTPRGIEVTGLISQVPDSKTVSLLLFVPVVRLEDGTAEPWAGLGIVITERQSIGGPALLTGPIHAYQARPVGGLATVVEFLGGGGYQV
jgi:hypothetical protein